MTDAHRKQARGEGTCWAEHLARAADAFAREIRASVPDEFSQHARGALRETLLAIRGIVDAGVARLDAEAQEHAPPHKVDIE